MRSPRGSQAGAPLVLEDRLTGRATAGRAAELMVVTGLLGGAASTSLTIEIKGFFFFLKHTNI